MNHLFDSGNVDGCIVDERVVALDQECQNGEARNKNGRSLQKIPRAAQHGRIWKRAGEERRSGCLGLDD